MFPYWILFGFFGLGALFSRARSNSAERYSSPTLAFGMLSIAAMIGLRNQVGTDWPAYVRMFRRAGVLPLHQALEIGDPGYMLVNWLVQQMGGPFWLVNLFCGIVFAWGLHRFVSVQSDPWLSALVATPYLVIVVAMGYSRQAVAIGILMAGLAELIRDRAFWRFLVHVAFASLFHASAIVMLPLAIIGMDRERLARLLVLPAMGYLIYSTSFSGRVDKFTQTYIATGLNSQGALVRVMLCVLPAVVFFLSWRRLRFNEDERLLWRNFSLAAFACVGLLAVLPSSTAVDRFALYLLPLEIVILPRLSFLIRGQLPARVIVVAFSTLVLFVWLNYAVNAVDWIPYRHF